MSAVSEVHAYPLAVVAAMREEVAPLLTRMVSLRSGRVHGCMIHDGSCEGVPVRVGVTGDGARAAAKGVEALLTAGPPVSRLLVLGVAGALSPDLRPGDLVVSDRVRHTEDRTVAEPDRAWNGLRTNDAAARLGLIVTSPRIVTRAEDKRRLLAELGESDDRSVAVDLETAIYAEAAERHGIPYTAVRAISDSADETLPLDFERFRDPHGSVRRGRVMLHALSHPAVIGDLRAMQRRVGLCAERLADAAVAWIGTAGHGGAE